MPNILAIESSTTRASLALTVEDAIVFNESFESDRSHNAELFDPLVRGLAALDCENLDLVVIGTGPGSYSGTRVGIAAGQGIAMIHGCPAVGLSSLLGAGIENGTAIGDARRGSFWWADVDAGDLPRPELVATAELRGRLRPGRMVFTYEDPRRFDLAGLVQARPEAVNLLSAWHRLAQTLKQQLAATAPAPAYLRPPHVTSAKPGHPLLRPRQA